MSKLFDLIKTNYYYLIVLLSILTIFPNVSKSQNIPPELEDGMKLYIENLREMENQKKCPLTYGYQSWRSLSADEIVYKLSFQMVVGMNESCWKNIEKYLNEENVKSSSGNPSVKGGGWSLNRCSFFPQADAGPTAMFYFAKESSATTNSWGCYNPKPGHPTNGEKKLFFEEIKKYALDAERQYGTPAGAIVAMSIIESGYGWTRIALNANNLFGWKFYGENSAGGRKYWVLECQPPEDDNSRYVQFSDRKDAVYFVAKKMATINRYKSITQKYNEAISTGADMTTSVNHWIDGIADAGYNWKPEKYKKDLKRIMNNYLSPSESLNEDYNLYFNTYNTSKMNLPDEDVERMKQKFEQVIKSGRYMEQNCKPITYPNWDGLPLSECRYEVTDKNGIKKYAKVIMLNPSAEQLARWTIATCKIVKGIVTPQYTDKLFNRIVSQSSLQFPIAGIVYEDIYDGQNWNPDGFHETYCFRDGVTVKIKNLGHMMTQQLTDEEIEKSLYGELKSWTGQYARLQGTTREQYKANGGKIDVGNKNDRKLSWLDVTRELYQKAWKSDRNELMIAWARQNL